MTRSAESLDSKARQWDLDLNPAPAIFHPSGRHRRRIGRASIGGRLDTRPTPSALNNDDYFKTQLGGDEKMLGPQSSLLAKSREHRNNSTCGELEAGGEPPC